jgi:hypothetical protein
MSSKKKSRPLFEVPAEIGSGRESGWVYRSGTPEKEAPEQEAPQKKRPAPRESSGADIGAESAQTLAMAFATLARSFVLAMTIAAIPMTLGFRALKWVARADRDR